MKPVIVYEKDGNYKAYELDSINVVCVPPVGYRHILSLDPVPAIENACRAVRKIQAMAGNPDPVEACRLIINECKDLLG